MIDAEQSSSRGGLAQATHQSSSSLELPNLTAGAVVDLCNVRREMVHSRAAASAAADGDNSMEDSGAADVVPYEPLEPYDMPVLARPPHIEPGRVEIRMVSLYDKLQRL